MSDLIDRQQAIDALREYLINKRVPEDGTLTARLVENEVINKLPSAEPQTGKWINGKCNRCGEHAPFWPMASTYHCSNFCPNCGRKMEVTE